MTPQVKTESLDFIASTIAVLFEPTDLGPLPIDRRTLAEFMHMPNPSQSTDGSLVITSNRDQLEVGLYPGKVDVRDFSGTPNRDKPNVPSVLHGIWPILGAKNARSYGVNFVISVTQEDPVAWLAKTFLNERVGSIFPKPLRSDTVHVSFDQRDITTTVRFQAIPDGTIMTNFNASQDISELPDEEYLLNGIKDQNIVILELLRNLGLGS